jgi:hypothetical protein
LDELIRTKRRDGSLSRTTGAKPIRPPPFKNKQDPAVLSCGADVAGPSLSAATIAFERLWRGSTLMCPCPQFDGVTFESKR